MKRKLSENNDDQTSGFSWREDKQEEENHIPLSADTCADCAALIAYQDAASCRLIALNLLHMNRFVKISCFQCLAFYDKSMA